MINVRKTKTGVGTIVYSAWEPATEGSHAVVELNGRPMAAFDRGVPIIGSSLQLLGQVGTRNLPPDIAGMPAGDARYTAYMRWQESEMKRAAAAIVEAHPDAGAGEQVGCELHVAVDEPAVKVRVFILEKYVEVEAAGHTPLNAVLAQAFQERVELDDERGAEYEEGTQFIPRKVVVQPRGQDAAALAPIPIMMMREIEGPTFWLAVEVEVRGATEPS